MSDMFNKQLAQYGLSIFCGTQREILKVHAAFFHVISIIHLSSRECTFSDELASLIQELRDVLMSVLDNLLYSMSISTGLILDSKHSSSQTSSRR